MSILIGEVIGVHGTRVTLKVFENSSKETLFFDGSKFKGVSIREYVSIRRGFREIVCIVEGEHLDERHFETEGSRTSYIRKIEAKPIGFLENGEFFRGIKYLPMIKDSAYLLSEDNVTKIYSRGLENEFVVGKMLKEDIPISLPWARLFNSHIGIFGNTGSGKSNTLAKLFTLLFEQKSEEMIGKSNFVILDFNGEYTNGQLTDPPNKNILKLNTHTEEDKFPLSETEFWNTETLSLLFQATTNTQRPFLNRVVRGRERYRENVDSLNNYVKSTFRRVFSASNPKGETLNLIRRVASLLNAGPVSAILGNVIWHSNQGRFWHVTQDRTQYFEENAVTYDAILQDAVQNLDCANLDSFEELILRSNLMLIRDLIGGAVQFEYIQPLMKRMESAINGLRKVLILVEQPNELNLLTIISLRRCNQEIKKILSLLIAKHFYHLHKERVGSPPDRTMHLIIDEAHNILSQQSAREHEIWKDYRLELFEEVIKEGRKFGMFLTLASQRPADISPTIVSQLHNFFIHRLVNDRDLFLLENTITTLDSLSRGLIPNLSQGSCVVTGTSFELPMVLQIDLLPHDQRPDSADVPLDLLWGN